jgi:hypothetical protein
MKRWLPTVLLYLAGFLLLAALGVEAALTWFMGYYLLVALRLFVWRRQRRPHTPLRLDDAVVCIIDPDNSYKKDHRS